MDFDATRIQFARDGFAVVAHVAGPEAIELAIAHRESLCSNFGLSGEAAIVAALPSDAAAASMADDAPLGSLASVILGVPVCRFGFTYLCKPPRSGLGATWHQDGAPWAGLLKGAPALTVWVALTDADETSGCLRVVPGSHRLPAQPLFPDKHEPSLFGVAMDPDLVDEERASSVIVRAGDVVVHHPNLIHGSFANDSGQTQIALAIRYRGREPNAQ